MDKLIQSLCLEEKTQTWEQQVEEEEAGHIMPHPVRHWDLSWQSMTHQIPTHSFFSARTHLTFHKQWKKGRCTVQTRFYRYVNNSVGPSIQQEMFALDLRSFSSAGADTPPVSPQGPCLFWCRHSKVQKCRVQLLHFSAGKFASSSCCLR